MSANANAVFVMRRVGEELARLREGAGLRQDDIAVRLGCTRHTVSKIERGKAFPTPDQLEEMLREYGANAGQRTAVASMVDQGRSQGRAWYEQARFRALYPGLSYRYFSLEDGAERISAHSGTYVPGLLQTREYIEALAAYGQKDEGLERREAFVEARMNRKAILSRSDPVILDALILEAALRSMVGGPEVMRTQLKYLIACAELPNVTLRVIPFSAGAASAVGIPFTIMDFPGDGDRSVVWQDVVRGDVAEDDPADVRRIRRKFADLTASALSEVETVRYIEEIEKEIP
ncbi:helix-turn-helix transcriptional regulator [Streptomyces sp. NPDC093085]|uniref:helix-turn-helix domain-containing protein n=1 Tax=Streptomyces sp. NPDC093085 TaxID=3155068 RepID=UPI0034224708